MPLLMDRLMARRLERAEARVGVSCVEVRQRETPEVAAVWHAFGGTYAIFDGATSPMTQSFGLGLFEPVTRDGMAELEAFFHARGAPANHEVSPLAGIETFALLVERGYRPIELGTVLVQRIAEPLEPRPAPGLAVRVCEGDDRAAWVDASVAGWSDDPAVASVIRSFVEIASRNRSMVHFVVEHGGTAVATGSLGIHDGIALLAGASTIPDARGRGAQSLLLTARIAEARRRGCDVALMVATPGSTSQRNAERRGFQVAYSRTKWQRDPR